MNMYIEKTANWYLSRPFLLAEVDSEGQIHGSKHSICFTCLRMADQLPQALVHDGVEERKVMPIHLQKQITCTVMIKFWKRNQEVAGENI